MEISPCHNSVAGHQIATNFCTCHDSCAETVTFFPVSFFPTCPLLLSFLLLFFLLLFFLPETVTFFPVTFFFLLLSFRAPTGPWSMFSTCKDFNYLCHFNFRKWYGMSIIYLYVLQNDWAHTGLNTLRLRQDGRHLCRRHFHMYFHERKLLNFK